MKKKEEFVFVCKFCKKEVVMRKTKVNEKRKYCSVQCRANDIKPWNFGLTKETDERIKSASLSQSLTRKQKFVNGEIKLWNFGLTKETDNRVKEAAEKVSFTRKQKFVSGEITSWNLGLTKETDERVLKNSVNTKKSMLLLMKDKESLVYKNHMRRSIIGSLKAQEQKSFTNIEVILYKVLDELLVQYEKQYPIHYWIVDAFIPESNLIIQADGEYWHNKKDVKQRDDSSNKYLEKCGFKILRFWGNKILNERQSVKEDILHAL